MDSYINEVVKKMEAELPTHKVSAQKVIKNNGVEKIGITIQAPDTNISPVFYISKEDMETCSVDDLAGRLLRIYAQQSEKNIEFDISKYQDYEGYIKQNISFAIVSKQRNQDTDRPSIDITPNLQVVFRVNVEINGESASIPVRKEHLSMWGNPSLDELMDLAVHNSANLDAALFMSMEDALFHIMEDAKARLDSEERQDIADMVEDCIARGGTGMYILSSQSKVYGAKCLLYKDTLETIKEKLGDDLIILPSSVHEAIVISKSMGDAMGAETLAEMVREVNATCVDEVDFLSDVILCYDSTGLHELDTATINREEI